MPKRSIFGGGKAIERRIDEFLDKVSETGMIAVVMLHHNIDRGDEDTSDQKLEHMLELKRSCSRIRREIEAELYTQMLIPDLLGDVVALIESLHRLVGTVHHAMRFNRYSPIDLPGPLAGIGKQLATAAGNAIENVVFASRAFFRDFTHVRDFVHKVGFHETECDEACDRLLKKIYESDLGLAEKNHFATVVREIDGIADDAEQIADSLTMYAIKRSE